MNKLQNKIIIVTGGNGLLGKEIVQQIRKEGAVCINVDINHETTPDLTNYHCDIKNTESVIRCIKEVIEYYGRIDGLVNNAYPRTNDWGLKFEMIPLESWQNNIDWQLNSYFYFCQIISNQMIKQNSGAIINMASIYGVVGPDFSIYEGTAMTLPAAYSAIKGGLINFTRYLASYLGKYQIRVNSVSPGGIFDNQSSDFVRKYENKVPLGRMGTPQDIAPSVVFLLSDDSKYITGQNLLIDGGWTAI
jgi:NAD(P)-dependent dehydrogenase (short-subunit alcohol dehydrogenase family)